MALQSISPVSATSAFSTPRAMSAESSGEATASAASVEVPVEAPLRYSYSEMVTRIPENHLRLIEAKMRSLSDFEKTIAKIMVLLNEGKYHELPEDAFFYALRGVKEKKVHGRIVIRVSDIETLRRKEIPFTVGDFRKKDGTLNEPLLDAALDCHLTVREKKKIKAKIARLDPIDTKILLFRSKLFSGKRKTLSMYTKESIGYNFCNIVRVKEKECIKISASDRILSTMLRVRYPKGAIKLNPVFGVSTVEQIRKNALTNTRDIACAYLLPIKGIIHLVVGREADGHRCHANEFKFHDTYHIFAASAFGEKLRKIMAHLYDSIKQHALENKERLSKDNYLAMRKLGWVILDMDFALFMSRGAFSEKLERIANAIFQSVLYSYEREIEMAALPESDPLRKKYEEGLRLKRRPFTSFEAVVEVLEVIAGALPKEEAFDKARAILCKKPGTSFRPYKVGFE